MLPPDQPLTLTIALNGSCKRSHSDTIGREDTRTHRRYMAAHPSEHIQSETSKILDIRAKKNKPERILDDAIVDDNNPHGDIATNHTIEDSTGENNIIDNGLIDKKPGGLNKDYASADNCTRSRPGTPTDRANLDIETSIGSSVDSDDRFSSETDRSTGDEDMSLTENDDSDRDRDRNPDDEGFFESDASSTTSLDSSAQDYLLLHGRKYPNVDIGYSYEPIDQQQMERWDANHVIYFKLFGGLHRAVIPEDCQRVLDIGTGTGIWAMDFADEHPRITVIGTDIAPIQPEWVPNNLEFQIEDCENEWTFKESSIDYIHARGLNGNVDRFELAKKAFKALKPKGIVEFVEVCIEPCTKKGTLATNSYIEQWGDFFRDAGEKRRKHFMVTNDGTLRKAMETAGFKDIEVYEYEIPIGPWPESKKCKKLGKSGLRDFERGIEGMMFRLGTEELKWRKNEIHLFAAELRKFVSLHWREYEFYRSCIAVVGKRPS